MCCVGRGFLHKAKQKHKASHGHYIAAEKTGRNVGQVLVRWALQRRPDCSVLPKSSNTDRIRGNLDVVCGGWRLDDDDLAALDGLSTQCRMVDGSFWLSPFGPYKVLGELWDDEEEKKDGN